MLLAPKKTKFKKIRKGTTKATAITSSNLLVGNYGLISLESGFIHATQLEAGRQTINRHLERKGRIWTIIFPDLGITKRPTQIRIGKGTGKVKYWAYRIRPGNIIFEVGGVSLKKAEKALNSGAQKLPIKVKLIK
jgi:large subunit ribosomal protein L16